MLNYKKIIKDMEKKLIDKTNNEEKLRKENESFKRQIQFYKEKMKIELYSKKSPSKNIITVKRKNDNIDLKNNTITPDKTIQETKRHKKNLTCAEINMSSVMKEKPKNVDKTLTPSKKLNSENRIINNNFQNFFSLNILTDGISF